MQKGDDGLAPPLISIVGWQVVVVVVIVVVIVVVVAVVVVAAAAAANGCHSLYYSIMYISYNPLFLIIVE